MTLSKLLKSSRMASNVLSRDEFKTLRKAFFKTEVITLNSLMDFTDLLLDKNGQDYQLLWVADKAAPKMSSDDVATLLAVKKSTSCPEWLKKWRYLFSDRTPDEHLKFVLDNGASIVSLNWGMIHSEMRVELLKIVRDGLKLRVENSRLERLAKAEERLASEMKLVAKLKNRTKRDASPTRQ